MHEYKGPIRLNKISHEDWVSFKDSFLTGSIPEFKELRLGQAFIVYKTVKGTVDPDLFYQSDISKAEKHVYEHYIYNVPLSPSDLKNLFETWFALKYGHPPKVDDLRVNTMYLTMFADGAFTGFKAGLLLKNSV